MKSPTPEQMLTAAEWLDINDGELGEAESCKAVAEWLRKTVARRDEQAAERKAIRALAEEKGIRPEVIRRLLRDRVSR